MTSSIKSKNSNDKLNTTPNHKHKNLQINPKSSSNYPKKTKSNPIKNLQMQYPILPKIFAYKMNNSVSQSLDSWSWEAVSLEFHQKLNRRLEERPKILEDRIVSLYLVNKCDGCTEEPCLNYHQGQRPRRALVYLGNGNWNYSFKKCNKPNCNQPKCSYSHTTEETFYHPENYRKKPCNYPLYNGKCSKFQDFCPFIHERNCAADGKNFKFDIDTYKTVKCEIVDQHNYRNCHFYHENLVKDDKRRSLKEFRYVAEMCSDCSQCDRGDSCEFCHNLIELNYHPRVYKTKLCMYKENCLSKEECPYYHIECNDKVNDKAKEIDSLIKKNSELNESLSKLQEKLIKYEKFKCSDCFINNTEYIMTCGHSKCLSCSSKPICSSCQIGVEIFTKLIKSL